MEEDVTIKKIATFITKFLVLDQHCMENLAWWLVVSVQTPPKSAIVGRRNSEKLRFCERERRATAGHFGCPECYMVSWWSALWLGWRYEQGNCPL
jgi:hypothetical protein